MNEVRKQGGVRFFAAACAVSILALGFSVRQVAAQTEQASKTAGGRSVAPTDAKKSTSGSGEMRFGLRVSELKNLPILPPIVVDYRDDDDLEDGLRSSAGLRSERWGGQGAAAAGPISCRQNAQCNDCDPCTLDTCSTHACQGGDRNGFGCDPDNNTCEGKCIGGIDLECPGGTCDFNTNLCVGGDNPGGSCTPNECFDDLGCCGDEGIGGSILNGACNLFPCVELTPPPGGGSQCVNALIPSTLFVSGSECDDGLECNGNETCSAGACVPGAPLCAPGTDTACDEDADSCVPFCASDDECDTDGDICTTDVCDAKTCVGGFRDGLACRSTGDSTFGCDEPPLGAGGNDGTCTGGGTGECQQDDPFCGPGSTECTPGLCVGGVNAGNACTSDANCVGAGAPGTCSCSSGRCCGGAGGVGTCNNGRKQTFAACQADGGAWFSTQDACGAIGQGGTLNVCPLYGVGIAPAGTLTTEVGPILSNNPNGCPNTLFSAGDDYAAVGAAGGYIAVEIVRFIASVQVTSRLTIEFWDTTLSPPVFIEDTFFVGSPGPGGPTIRQLIFDPPLVVPDTGVLALVNADRFTPLGASSFGAVSDLPVIGTSSADDIWLNGSLVSGGVLGVCNGGTRDGGWCDGGLLATCPGGTCDQSIPDRLGFEIVATTTGDPTGACCDTDTGACSLKLPWVCEDDGDVFQGAGSFCKACANDPFTACTTVADCPACTGDPNSEGDPCDPLADPSTQCNAGAGFCIATATCSPVPPACAVQGCCATTDVGNIPVCNTLSDNPGFYCPNGDTDCDGPGGACDATASVVEGNCVSVRGGCDTLVNGQSVPCSQDADCLAIPGAGTTCLNNACPTGTGTGGGNFGSSCEPSVCVQPQFVDCPGGVCSVSRNSAGPGTCIGGGRDGLPCLKLSGGDNCFDVPVHPVPVPALQSPPIALTTTITGNNAEATYDDWNEGFCEGGTNDTNPCDPNAVDQEAECPGGECARLCGSGIFNPDGATADPGWWEGFRITECANVRVGLCGSSLVVQPAWAFLSVGCPCATFLGNAGVDPPIGTGLGGEGSERGKPFCTLSDNLWQTFRNLPPGTYYYPILSDPDGTCAAPVANPDEAGCTYQLQITTGACLEAACCADAECAGGDDAGLPCDANGLVNCPDGACVGGLCDAGILIGHPCVDNVSVDQCPGGGVCTPGPVCTQANELRCNAAGGFFAAELNLPPLICDGGDHQGNACEGDADCPPNANCVQAPSSGFSCTIGELGVCEFGACCGDPGECNGEDPNSLFDRDECAIEFPSGRFIAGSRCNYPLPPCPVCTAAETPGNCQEDTGGFFWFTDRLNGGQVIADDFEAVVPEISQFCSTFCYFGINQGECSDPNGPLPPPPNQWFIRFLQDGSIDANPDSPPGFPGDLNPGSPLGDVVVPVAAQSWLGNRCHLFSFVFDPPITGFVEGNRYWVEFSGLGALNETTGVGCGVGVASSLDGNGWAFSDPDLFGFEESGGRIWDVNDVHVNFEGNVNNPNGQDFTWCIEGGLVIPPRPTGACCKCDGCEDNAGAGVAPEECLFSFSSGSGQVSSTVGDFYPGQTCAEIECENIDAGCPGGLGALAEDCGNPMCLGPAGTTCADGAAPEVGFELFQFTRIAKDVVPGFRASTNCSTADGPAQYTSLCEVSPTRTGKDQWFEVHAPGTGKFEFDVCGSFGDVVTAVYTNGTFTCPNDVALGGACPPAESQRVFCADTECRDGIGNPTGTVFVKETCNGGDNAGQPCPEGASDCPNGTCEGQCLLVRIATFANASGTLFPGTFQMETFLDPTNCPISSPPAPDQEFGNDLTMNRGLAFSAGDPGIRQGIRVRIDSAPTPSTQFLVGSTWWVQGPTAKGEKSDDPNPVVGLKNFLVSELGCTPFYTDWHGVCDNEQCEGGLRDGFCQNGVCIGGQNEGGTCANSTQCPGDSCTSTPDCGGGIVNIIGEMMMPGASYTVSVVGENCDPTDEANFVDGSAKFFTSVYGNVAGQGGPTGWQVPDAPPVAVADALAILGKFSSASNSMRKLRADTEPSKLDFRINVTDVLQVLSAFGGGSYPFLSCRLTQTAGLICFGGPANQQSCATDLDCRIPLCPGQGPASGVASR